MRYMSESLTKKNKKITVYLPETLYQLILDMSDEERRSMSSQVVWLIEKAIESIYSSLEV